MSGLGVRPRRCSARKYSNTRSQYSRTKLTASRSRPSRSQTSNASRASIVAVQGKSGSVSSQFFMNTPLTCQPWRCSSSMAADESTPPSGGAGDVGAELDRIAPAVEAAVHAAHHQRTAELAGDLGHFITGEPPCADDAGIERLAGIVVMGFACETTALVGDVAVRMHPAIDAYQRSGAETPGGFLTGLANHRVDKAFTGFDVSGGLIVDQALAALLFNQQVTAVLFDDGGNGDMRCPDHGETITQSGGSSSVAARRRRCSALDFSPYSRRERIQFPIADAVADQAQSGVAHRRGHAPHLAGAPLAQGDLEPRRRDAGALTNGRDARPQRGLGNGPRAGGSRRSIIEHDAVLQLRQRAIIRHALHLHPIGLFQFMARIADAVLQTTVICEHHETFAVAVESTGRIHARHCNEIGEGGAAGAVGELAEHVVRFVEQYDLGHGIWSREP